MIIQNRELEELQQRIREAEERLKARESIVPESSSKNAGQRDGESRSAGESRSVYISQDWRTWILILSRNPLFSLPPIIRQRRATRPAGYYH